MKNKTIDISGYTSKFCMGCGKEFIHIEPLKCRNCMEGGEIMKTKKTNNKIFLFIIGIIVLVILFALASTRFVLKAEAKPCKSENAECNVNDSNKLCCPGLVCMDKGVPSDIGKCQLAPTATPTSTPIPTLSPTPKPPKDYCKNFEKDQKEIPYGMESVEGYCDCMKGFHRVEETRTLKKDYDTFTCELDEPEVTPTPEVTPEPTPVQEECKTNCGSAPTFSGSSTEPPQCTDKAPQAVVNPHVYRKGDVAVVKWYPVDGSEVNIYYKQVNSPDWQYSVRVANTGYAEVKGLGSMDISFAVQAVNGCSGGVSVMSKTIVDGDTDGWVLFQ